MSRRLIWTVLVIFVALPVLAAPLKWADGQVLSIKREHGFYYYQILNANDRYTGRSLHRYHVQPGKIKFTIHGSTLYMLDEKGNIRKTRYVLQALIPPPPPPVLPEHTDGGEQRDTSP